MLAALSLPHSAANAVSSSCHRKDSGCLFDHSAAGQERCIKTFYLLAKRELSTHAQLPPWSPVKPAVNPAGRKPLAHTSFAPKSTSCLSSGTTLRPLLNNQRMRTYFYVPSNSPIASPLVVAPKAAAPFIRHCGDYRE
jgi:hypothetical protein